MKNNFTFRDEFKQIAKDEFKQIAKDDFKCKRFSPDLFSEQSECNGEFDDLNSTTHGFISGDLMATKKVSMEQKLPFKKKKLSLTYTGEILFGVHPVYLALLQKKRKLYHLYTRDDINASTEDSDSRKGEIIKLARLLNIPMSFLDSRGLRILAPGAVHQGVCLDVGFLQLSTWNNKCNIDASDNRELWLVLDEILDPMNVGAIIRSAYYFGVNKLFTVRGNSCKLSPTVSKASSGTLEVMDIYEVENLEKFIRNRKDNGWSIVSTLAFSSKSEFHQASIPAEELSISKPTILILGSEGKGISQNILHLCDALISIEPGQMLHQGIDSLNVSVAAGVLLYALNNSRNIKR